MEVETIFPRASCECNDLGNEPVMIKYNLEILFYSSQITNLDFCKLVHLLFLNMFNILQVLKLKSRT